VTSRDERSADAPGEPREPFPGTRPSSDTELVARSRAGDLDAWKEIVSRFSSYVYTICLALGLSPEDTEDVFQEAFAQTYQHLNKLRDDQALRPWLAQLTRRLALDNLRAAQRETLTGEKLGPDDSDQTLSLLDDAFAVRQAMEKLSPECQDILDRFFVREESYDTIGDALGLPAGTIAHRISRCLTKLREAAQRSG